MVPRDVRPLLLRQHDRLRVELARCESAARRFRDGCGPAIALRHAVTTLRDAFAAHNVTEEAWLRPLLAGSAALGERRIARMLEEHLAEHAMLSEQLVGPDDVIAARMPGIVEELEAHMAAEERTFLSRAVLPDVHAS